MATIRRSNATLFPILAVTTGAFFGTGQFCTETFAVLADATIVLACTPESGLFCFDLKGVRTFLQSLLDSSLSSSFRVLVCIVAAHTSAHIRSAHFSVVEARTVQLEATRPDTVTCNLTRWKL